ncbi:hypothetical protein [Cytobacillus sp. IB215665]|uniref:hypothetical protein n=1 Tax=Cytobacillus sp. IB215665 TaxID=3097357 RepID=UPI002A15565C|nr:hypothetical protein [Cytobacillus sp. IB215665]MDX8364504.1 hypothetical protein [Cytobacillus sp. IB215665]
MKTIGDFSNKQITISKLAKLQVPSPDLLAMMDHHFQQQLLKKDIKDPFEESNNDSIQSSTKSVNEA